MSSGMSELKETLQFIMVHPIVLQVRKNEDAEKENVLPKVTQHCGWPPRKGTPTPKSWQRKKHLTFSVWPQKQS